MNTVAYIGASTGRPSLARARGPWLVVLAGMIALGSLASCTARTAAEGGAEESSAAEEQRDYLASRGFYQRRDNGTGWFMTRSDPAMARSRTLSDALRTVPGVNVIARGAGAMVVSNRTVGNCPLAVFVDGLYTTIRNVDELTHEDIEAVEVYRGPAEMPAGFNAPPTERTCGALLVWTRIDVGD